jgi:hypothetical protein
MIWGFRREADENCALPSYYAVISGNSLPTFPDSLSVPSSSVDSLPLKMGPIGCLAMSVRNYHYSLRNNPQERTSHVHIYLLYASEP